MSGGIVIPYSHPKTELITRYISRNTSKIQRRKAWEIRVVVPTQDEALVTQDYLILQTLNAQ